MQLRYLLPLIVIFATAPASAQTCTFTNTGLDWGNVNLIPGTSIDLTGTLTASCTGTGNRTVRVCPNFNAGVGGVNATGSERYMLNGANQLRYNLYQDSGRSVVWGSRTWGLAPLPPTLDVSLSGGVGSNSATIYGRILSGQAALPTGAYSSAFSGTNTEIAYDYSPATCASMGLSNVTNVPFTVQANYPATCSVMATNLNFGSHGVLATALTTTNNISVTCSSTTPYTISLSGGNSGAANPTQRKMANGGNTEFVTYGIYQNAAHTLPWGSTIGTDTVAGTGAGAAQPYTAYGQVPAQTTPSAQTYTDTIVVTVTY
jgi:spore coat protein U-like protein